MEIISELMAHKGFDAVWGLFNDTIISKIKSSAEQQKINEKLEAYLSRKLKGNWFCTRKEEIDFEGLANYIRGDLLADVEVRLFGKKQERDLARKKILEKSATYANAKTKLSKSRAQHMANDVMDMLKDFWRSQVPKDLRMMSGEIVDDINENIASQTQQLSNQISNSQQEIMQKIDNMAIMDLDRNVLLLNGGNVCAVEKNLNSFLNTISSEHNIPGYFRYTIQHIKDSVRLVSVPINPDAYKFYPPKIKGSASFEISGVSKERWMTNIFEYANRHQLNIIMTVLQAEKYLGEIKDPSQAEAETMIGEKYIIPPQPFPPAFACCIIGDDNIIVNYLLLRTIDISDEGIYTITNDEQKGRRFSLTLKHNPQNGEINFIFSANGFGNLGRFEILKILRDLCICDKVEIKLLDQDKNLICGHLKATDQIDNRSIDKAISFYAQVLNVEKYFSRKIKIPSTVTETQIEDLEYISELICGGICESSWDTLSCNFIIDKVIKETFLNYWDNEYEIQFVTTVTVNLWENTFLMPRKK